MESDCFFDKRNWQTGSSTKNANFNIYFFSNRQLHWSTNPSSFQSWNLITLVYNGRVSHYDNNRQKEYLVKFRDGDTIYTPLPTNDDDIQMITESDTMANGIGTVAGRAGRRGRARSGVPTIRA